ncbi:MAG: fibronectin type III domain-containing protein [Candidatus Fermentibacteria bacterium]|nr:fibronectin type III domain-containing protein [Candidatus Fermentibacteria bacterium]
MKRLVFFAAIVALITACGPDNPFEPDNPSPSALTGVASSSTTAKLSWTMCPDSDFASYTLYRSPSSGIAGDSGSATVLIVINKNTTTTYFDQGLQAGATWYYALLTTNEGGGISWSNEVSVKIP